MPSSNNKHSSSRGKRSSSRGKRSSSRGKRSSSSSERSSSRNRNSRKNDSVMSYREFLAGEIRNQRDQHPDSDPREHMIRAAKKWKQYKRDNGMQGGFGCGMQLGAKSENG